MGNANTGHHCGPSPRRTDSDIREEREEREQRRESVLLLREIRDGIAELNAGLAALLAGDGDGER